MAQATADLQQTLATLPSTGRGAATLTLSGDGIRAEVGQRWRPNITSAAYWQRSWTGAQHWGALTRVTW